MGGTCSKGEEEYETMVELQTDSEVDANPTYLTKSRAETLKSLKSGDLLFVRNGDIKSEGSEWIRFGVAVYAPTQLPGADCMLVETKKIHVEAEFDALSREVISNGARLVAISGIVEKLGVVWSVYVRRLKTPKHWTTTNSYSNYDSDRSQADAVEKMCKNSKDVTEESFGVSLLKELQIFQESSKAPDENAVDWLARDPLPTQKGLKYDSLEKIF